MKSIFLFLMQGWGGVAWKWVGRESGVFIWIVFTFAGLTEYVPLFVL